MLLCGNQFPLQLKGSDRNSDVELAILCEVWCLQENGVRF